MKIRLILILLISFSFIACEEDNPGPSCDGSLALTFGATVNPDCGDNNGAITLTASGGNGGNMYMLENGTAQASPTFTDLSQGFYSFVVEDSEGCTATTDVALSTGVVLNDIRSIITTSCAISNCHNGDRSNLPNFAVDDILKANAAAVKSRTGNQTMPPGAASLTTEEIQLIACWVDDGAN